MGASYSVADIPNLSGKVALITGGTAGLGLVSATELARKGAHVIIVARSPKRGNEALAAIKLALGPHAAGAKIEYGVAEHEDLHSIQAFASWFLSKDLPLHILMLNAGVAYIPYKVIAGVEAQMFINHISHQLLARLLLPKLKSSAPSRVVVLSSEAHRMVSSLVLDPPTEKEYNTFNSYSYSKLANIHFTKALQSRLSQDNIYVNAVHPGMVSTNITTKWASSCALGALALLFRLFALSPAAGALTQLYAATSPEVERRSIKGQYLYPTAKVRSKLPRYATDEAIAEHLWEWTEAKIREVLAAPPAPPAPPPAAEAPGELKSD